MDKSPEFIKMLKQAKEIQELWRPQVGDYVQWDSGTTPIIMDEEPSVSRTFVWLPRQDQLQEMIKDNFPKLDELAYFFWNWMTRTIATVSPGFTSMEQLWLAFTMNSLFQKSWNGQEWENISEKIKPANSEIEVGEIDYDEPAKFIFPFFR